MESLEWYPVFYNGLETNVEVTKCARVRRIKTNWINYNSKIGEIDFRLLKITKGYIQLGLTVKGSGSVNIRLHQLMAVTFLNHKASGHKIEVDHIDNNKLNNHIDNLTLISHRENISKAKSLKSKLPTGVCFNKALKKYQSYININKIRYHLGYFLTIEEASNAYQQKLKSLT
jgi:hypothetical protein